MTPKLQDYLLLSSPYPNTHTLPHRSVEQVLVEVKEEKGKVDEVCQRRHRRWSLFLQLDTLCKDTEKVCVTRNCVYPIGKSKTGD